MGDGLWGQCAHMHAGRIHHGEWSGLDRCGQPYHGPLRIVGFQQCDRVHRTVRGEPQHYVGRLPRGHAVAGQGAQHTGIASGGHQCEEKRLVAGVGQAELGNLGYAAVAVRKLEGLCRKAYTRRIAAPPPRVREAAVSSTTINSRVLICVVSASNKDVNSRWPHQVVLSFHSNQHSVLDLKLPQLLIRRYIFSPF